MDVISQDEIINIKNSSKVKHVKLRKISFFSQLIGYIIIIIFLLIILRSINSLKVFLRLIKSNQKINEQKAHEDNKPYDKRLGNNLSIIPKKQIIFYQKLLEFESQIPYLKEINKRRIFENRYPLPDEINCYEHMRTISLMELKAFTSFLTKDTTFFEFGSGCSSVMAKYYAKKSYAVEGDRKWYEIGLKNNLKENILFKDIKPGKRLKGQLWSTPGPDSNPEDWREYFQAYKPEYNADVIFIDGRFRVACAFDIFNKIKDDTIVLIHEYFRPEYLIIGQYYDYVYHWGALFMFKKKPNIKEIPLDYQKKFWNDST